ncbi:hypothetical protein SPHINGO391_70009 [Sphingomonas aurantiaca]|uniref:Uncharacterized protein n=1 Tax=Sphingomonas aurantiaca TaxID=185949 RepID=A0A5E8ATL5_9SPHN|nr:hypothetical protein SPHINGO391_70009 [Sphingomonas aurantiaca]
MILLGHNYETYSLQCAFSKPNINGSR